MLVVLLLLLTTLASSHRRAIPLVVGIHSRIICFATTILTMLAALRANILEMNRHTTAITNNHRLPLFHITILQ
jgi:hypothetical protein